MFPTFGRGERKGQAVPRWGKNFLRWRVRPIAQKLEIPESLITFQVMRRTLGTDLQQHGTLKDAQGALRHASIRTTGDVYMQTIESERPQRDELPHDGRSSPAGNPAILRWEDDRDQRIGSEGGEPSRVETAIGPSWTKSLEEGRL